EEPVVVKESAVILEEKIVEETPRVAESTLIIEESVKQVTVEPVVPVTPTPSVPPVPPVPPTTHVPPTAPTPPVSAVPPTPPMPPTMPASNVGDYSQPNSVPPVYYGNGGVPPQTPTGYTGYEETQILPDYPEYIEEEKKKGKLWLWVTFAALGVLVISILVGILASTGVFESIGDKFSSRSSRSVDSYYYDTDSATVEDVVVEEAVVADEVDSAYSGYSYSDSQTRYAMGFQKGRNYLDGEMIHTDGQRFPFKVSFDFDPYGTPEITNVVYDNSNYNTKINLRATEFYGSFVRFEGNGGNKEFILQFQGDNPYSGDAWWGDFHQDVELSLR
ncbi:MAG: hypothetical protein K2H18_03970, partial [Muribaculaceae bacterium]|nr:hypothetical protein [Muribaculaceae bacterium]